MRKRFELQYEFGAKPIEQIKMPERSRDELPPVLRALQHIYCTPELNQAVFDLLEGKVLAGVNNRTGRMGMSLWEILVLAVVRLTLNIDYDRLEHVANYDRLVRELLGISDWHEAVKRYPVQTLKDNLGLLDEETLMQINELVVGEGHHLLKKKAEAPLHESRHAGGADKNRMQVWTGTLDAGSYRLRYISDDSHSYNSWNAPQPINPNMWGIHDDESGLPGAPPGRVKYGRLSSPYLSLNFSGFGATWFPSEPGWVISSKWRANGKSLVAQRI